MQQAASVQNLRWWLDGLALGCMKSTCHNPLVKVIDGRRQEGLYHQMSQHEHSLFLTAITTAQVPWATECAQNNLNAGLLFSIEKPSVTVIQKIGGPFT